MLSGSILSAITVTTLALMSKHSPHTVPDAQFQFGEFEGYFSISVLGVSSIITIVALGIITQSDTETAKTEIISKVSEMSTINVFGFDMDPEDTESGYSDTSLDVTKPVHEESKSKSSQKKRHNTHIQLTRHKFLLHVLSVSMITGSL